jgi:hypothetical protein
VRAPKTVTVAKIVKIVPVAIPRSLRAACSIAALSLCAGLCAAIPSMAIEPGTTALATLPDAPQPNLPAPPSFADLASSQPLSTAFSLASTSDTYSVSQDTPGQEMRSQDMPNRKLTNQELDAGCQSGEIKGKPCKLIWAPMLWEMFEATTVENMGNIALDSDTRNALTTHPFLASWFKCVHQYRYRQWSDDTPFVVHDIGHPMQGATVYAIYEQNDPKSRGLPFVNNGNYWRAHLKAMAVVTLYEIQWKIGPASEASIGNSGYNTYYTPSVIGRTTNETGFQDFFITPVYGLGWNITEDLVDKYVMPHIWKRTHNKWILTALLPITPCRDAANVLRYKPFYYRDYPLTPLR